MSKQLLHTPEGVRDIYSDECEKKLFLQNAIHNVLKSYGYEDIQTPSFEFFDIFASERGSVASKNMYKFFDREGYTLVLRPDMTPSIARAVSKYYSDTENPVRLCYIGNTFINNSEYQGKLKEITQAGVEFIGDAKSDADAEIVALTISSLLACGLKDFQVEVGHVGFLAGLLDEIKLSEDDVFNFKELLSNKNYFGVEELVGGLGLDDNMTKLLTRLPELVGQEDAINEASKYITNKTSKDSLDRLQKVYDILKIYGYEKYVSFDLGMVSNYNYYTGIILKGYTYGTGDAIVTGGRYDKLLSQFGKDSPSIGFGINIDQLLTAMNRQEISIPIKKDGFMIVYSSESRDEAIKKAIEYRKENHSVQLICKSSRITKDEYMDLAQKSGLEVIWLER